MAQSVTFWAAAALYAMGTALFFVWLAFRRDGAARWAVAVTGAGLVPHAASLALRWMEVGHGPFSTRYEVLRGPRPARVMATAGNGRVRPVLVVAHCTR